MFRKSISRVLINIEKNVKADLNEPDFYCTFSNWSFTTTGESCALVN